METLTQDKASLAKEEHLKRQQLKKAELKMYKDEAIAVEAWLLECRMEKIAKRYADKMITELIRTPFKTVGKENHFQPALFCRCRRTARRCN